MQLTKAEQRTKTALSNLIDLGHPVALAVEPCRAEAIRRTREQALRVVEQVRKELAEAGNDLNKCAPYPSGNLSRTAYMVRRSKYDLFQLLTQWRKGTYMPNEPHFADVTQEKIDRYVSEAEERAGLDYDAFIVKLCGKIGACQLATLVGEHVWGYSHLIVTKADGTTETWKTQQIINQSKLGKLFNQWPSRKVKGE